MTERDRHAGAASDPVGYATHLVGGLLLGAALVALVQLFAPVGAAQPAAALALAIGSALGAWAAERRRGALVAEAGYGAALVAAASVPFFALGVPLLSLAACALAAGVAGIRRGATPIALLAVAAFFVGAQHAARVDLLAPRDAASEGLLLLALAGHGALLVRDRRARWGGYALALHGLALVLATFPLLDAIGVIDGGIAALGVGAVAGALFAAGLRLDARALVAAMSAVLTLAAIAFAFLALGPALAAMVLLLLGAALVWQAEALRGYFAPPENAAH